MQVNDIAIEPPTRRRRGRPSLKEIEILERALLATATELFCAKGYGGATMEEVALAAAVGKKALYARYKNKASLFLAVVDHIFPDRHAWNIEGLGDADAELSLEEGLARRARLILLACCRPQAVALTRLVQHEADRFPEIVAVFDHFTSEVLSGLTLFFRGEKARGRIGDIEPQTAATMFMMAIVSDASNRTIYQQPMPEPAEIELYAANMSRLFARGLAPTPTTPASFASLGPSRFR
jgi:AcrR family transcriptional regulator